MDPLRDFTFVRGRETHTFTAIGRCKRTGRLGVSVPRGKSAPAGGFPRCAPMSAPSAPRPIPIPGWGRSPSGGYPANRVMAELEACDPHIEWRQLGIVDQWGRTAVRTGARNHQWAGHITGDGWVVMGNAVVDEGVADAMARAMDGAGDEDIETRPMKSITAGTDAGGQPNGQRAAAILVHENEGYSIVNLRIDDHDEPMTELWRLLNKLHPLVPYYRERPENPEIGRVADWARERGLEP